MMVTANSWSSRPTMPPMNTRDEHRGQREGHREDGEADLLRRPRAPPRMRGFAHLHVAHDVLEHHDGVVHHEADRERQRHQREIVQAEAEQVHHGEGADDRHRQRQAGDDGRRHVAQEQRRSPATTRHDGQHQRELHVVDGRADRLASGRSRTSRSTDGGSCAREVRQHAA